jgi:hypothetical protein
MKIPGYLPDSQGFFICANRETDVLSILCRLTTITLPAYALDGVLSEASPKADAAEDGGLSM